jgi:hypothetical protein
MAISLFDKIIGKTLSRIPDLFTLLSSEIQIRDADLGFQIAQHLRILELDVNEISKLMVHPREDGSQQADFKVQFPSEITITGVFESEDYASGMEELRIAQRTASNLTIQGRGNSFFDMYIETLPQKASAANFSTLSITIGLKEAILLNTSPVGFKLSDVADPLNSSIVQQGLKDAKTRVDTNFNDFISDSLGGFFS